MISVSMVVVDCVCWTIAPPAITFGMAAAEASAPHLQSLPAYRNLIFIITVQILTVGLIRSIPQFFTAKISQQLFDSGKNRLLCARVPPIGRSIGAK